MPSELTLDRLKLTNFRCFTSVELDFHRKLTVLVASNGMGKTAVLDAIAVAFGPFVGAFDEAVGRHFDSSDIRQIRARESQTHEMEYADGGVHIKATGWIPTADRVNIFDRPAVWSRSLSGPTGSKTTIKDARDLIEYGKELQTEVRTPGRDVTLPLIAYYGTGRLWQQKKLTDAKLPRTSRTLGYADCLDPASSYKSFLAWFRYWNFNAKDQRIRSMEQGLPHEATEFDALIASVNWAVNICLEPAGWKDISYSFSRDALVAVHDQHGELPVERLSDGIRNMIGMVADIAFRATKLNPQLGARASRETPGIVLIDEVDMHLHPEWQQVVLQGLMQAFPEVQFIVTTHSPQVLSTVSKEHIRILREIAGGGHEAVMPDFSPLAHEAGDALAKVMGTHPHAPLALLATVQQFEQQVRAGREASDEAQALKRQLDEAGYQLHESDLATWRFLAQRRAMRG
ncbi:MAG: AAA family ATPase [Leptothrix ochracea]|uniref:AAA family ATPase n=1 Tax=Leptothrix ochracea TaxID=735331 RepID=UPI0034E2DCEE